MDSGLWSADRHAYKMFWVEAEIDQNIDSQPPGDQNHQDQVKRRGIHEIRDMGMGRSDTEVREEVVLGEEEADC